MFLSLDEEVRHLRGEGRMLREEPAILRRTAA